MSSQCAFWLCISVPLCWLFYTATWHWRFRIYISILVSLLVCIYLLLSIYWSYLDKEQIPGYETIPASAKAVAALHPRREVVKLSEIFFQDVVAVAVIQQLFMYEYPTIISALVFTAVVAFVHLPSIKMFGRYYGSFFLYGSILLAPLALYLVDTYGANGLFVLFSLHVSSYIVWYGGSYSLARYKQ